MSRREQRESSEEADRVERYREAFALGQEKLRALLGEEEAC